MEQKLEIPVIKKNSKVLQTLSTPLRPKETAAKGMSIDLIFILQRPQVLNPITVLCRHFFVTILVLNTVRVVSIT